MSRQNVRMEQTKAYRALEGRKVAGVAMGLARHLGADVRLIRIVFVAATILGSGAGLLAYLALWALLPMDPEEAATADDGESPSADPGWIILIAVVSSCAVLALVALGFTSLATWVFPVTLAVIGIVLVWLRADEVQRAKWRSGAADAAADAASFGRWRVIVGSLAVLAAVVGIAWSQVGITTMLQGLATTVLLVVGLVLVAFPWLHQRWEQRSEERAAHIRAEERADMAARIHDSVLQTLTLLQKHANDAQRVQQLARAEERELREWLYGEEKPPESVTIAIRMAAKEVEDRHGSTIDVVVVGDAAVDSRIEALLAAAQEAMVNAAKHSGAGSTQVYAEVEPERISVFVRDRGCGFDPATVPDDRAGVRDSIEARMARVGGEAVVRSVPGDGTEVSLVLPRAES